MCKSYSHQAPDAVVPAYYYRCGRINDVVSLTRRTLVYYIELIESVDVNVRHC